MSAPNVISAIQTKVVHYPITLTDVHPTLGPLSFTFPRMMVADPLTMHGVVGSEPDGKASWWAFFQERHKLQYPYWVQGHMLNHNVHGEGKDYNLVPISHVLNTNMSAMVEEEVKKRVGQGRVLRYVVEAHWEGFRQTGTGFADATDAGMLHVVGFDAGTPRVIAEFARGGR